METSKNLKKTVSYLKGKKKILFITTSNRWKESQEVPKSTQLAHRIAELVGSDKVDVVDVTSMKIFACEGNISSVTGNGCGVKDASLPDKKKNPSGNHRCWASINNPDDELWKITKKLFECDAVVFFVSARWGQTNAYYQHLIERLSWIENRQTTLGEKNVVEGVDAGIIVVGHNWRVKDIVEVEKNVLSFFGFNTPKELFWGYQYTQDAEDETQKSYEKTIGVFEKLYGFKLNMTALHEIKRAIKKLLFGK
jgi:multimeric flavodoxin WrbA